MSRNMADELDNDIKNNLLRKHGCNQPLKLVDLKEFADKNTNILLNYNEIYNLIAKYSLNTTMGENKMVCVKSLKECRVIVSEKYEEKHKINVMQTLQNIDKWINIATLYIKSLEEREEHRNNISNIDFPLSIYDYIERKEKTVSFQEAFLEYKQVYLIPDDQPGDLKQFKRYLWCNFIKIDEQEFMKILMRVGSLNE